MKWWALLSILFVLVSCRKTSKTNESQVKSTRQEVVQQFATWQQQYQAAYPRGDFYYLIGNLSRKQTDQEIDNFASVSRWLANQNYRTILNTNAGTIDIREAAMNPNTVAIIWSSHANKKSGSILSTGGSIPSDAFTKNKAPSLKLVIFSNCWGDIVHKKYDGAFSSIYWNGTTDSEDLRKYLFSDRFDKAVIEASKDASNKLKCNTDKMQELVAFEKQVREMTTKKPD